MRVYDKQLERNRKLSATGTHIDNPWVRWELELKNDRAVSVSKMLTSGIPLGAVAVGVLGHYMRMIELDDINRSRCSTYPVWADFMDGVSSLKITVPKYEKTMDEKKTWIKGRSCLLSPLSFWQMVVALNLWKITWKTV